MQVSGLTFAKTRGALRLDAPTKTQRRTLWLTVAVQAMLLGLSAILYAKAFLVDYPAATSFLAPETLMTLQCAGFLSICTLFYWLLSGVHLRVTAKEQWQVDAIFAVLTAGLALTAFIFGYNHTFTEVFAKYLFVELVWFLIGLLGISLIPWASGTFYMIKFARPLRMFAIGGLIVRAAVAALLTVARLYFNGVRIYDAAATESLLQTIGFTSALSTFYTVLWLILLLVAFAVGIGALITISLGTDSFLKSTAKISRPLLLGAFIGSAISLVYTAVAAVGDGMGTMAWLALGVSVGLSLIILLANTLLKLKGMPEVLRSLTVCLQLLVIITVSFAFQYFLSGTELERATSFVLTIPALLLTAVHMVTTGVASGTLCQRSLTMVLASVGSAAVTYVFLAANGFADLLPREVPVKTMFNFILIGAVLLSAIYACGRLLFSTNAATRLLALRAAGF